jgi:hypothetical protein
VPALALEGAQHVLRADELVAEDATRDSEEVPHEGVSERVPNRYAFLARRHDVVRAQHGEVLGDARLIKGQGGLELLDGSGLLHQELNEPNPNRVRQSLEESRLERLELSGPRLARHDVSLYMYSVIYQDNGAWRSANGGLRPSPLTLW